MPEKDEWAEVGKRVLALLERALRLGERIWTEAEKRGKAQDRERDRKPLIPGE